MNDMEKMIINKNNEINEDKQDANDHESNNKLHPEDKLLIEYHYIMKLPLM